MGYGNTDSGGTKVVVGALATLVIAAFVIGGFLVGDLQGFIPEIVRETVRKAQLENDKIAAELDRVKKENERNERSGELALAQQKAWGEMVLSVVRAAGMQLAGALPWVVVIVVLAAVVRFVAPPLLYARAIALSAASRHSYIAPPTVVDAETVHAYKQTHTEKNSYRAERELARQRERRERALALREQTRDRFNGHRRAT